MDYQSHFYQTQNAPPNVNFQCTTAGGTIGGGSLPDQQLHESRAVPLHPYSAHARVSWLASRVRREHEWSARFDDSIPIMAANESVENLRHVSDRSMINESKTSDICRNGA
jgi:hypothetical protein